MRLKTDPAGPTIIEGLLPQGGSMALQSPVKTAKTWMLQELALAVASGQPWLGFRTTQVPVRYLNLEVCETFWHRRLDTIASATGLGHVPNLAVHHAPRAALGCRLFELLGLTYGLDIGLIIIDSIDRMLADIADPCAVADMLMHLKDLSARTGAAVLWGHHFSKGNQAGKAAMDRVSGAGAWSRDPDALVTLTPHEQDDHFTMEFVVRNCPPRNPMVVRWEFPMFRPEDEDEGDFE